MNTKRAVFTALALFASRGEATTSADCVPKPPPRGGAYELIYQGNCSAYIADNAGGEITDSLFMKWAPTNSWSLNPSGVRYITMDATCLFGSPGEASLIKHFIEGGEPWKPVQWIYLANACPSNYVLGGCFPKPCEGINAPDGSLKYYEISKCHHLKWSAGRTVGVLSDGEGNEYIMHATPNANASLHGLQYGNPTLPAGWVHTTRVLDADLHLAPSPDDSSSKPLVPGSRTTMGSFPCGYALVQDSKGNAYHRMKMTTGAPMEPSAMSLLLGGYTPLELTRLILSIAIPVGIIILTLCAWLAIRRFACKSKK